MIVDEAVNVEGESVVSRLCAEAPGFALQEGTAGVGVYSAKILMGVIERYARPLEADSHYEGETLELSSTATLMAWYYKSPVDLENKLYLVLLREGQAPIAVLSRQVVSALRFLSRNNAPATA